jgi:hypothetical protein
VLNVFHKPGDLIHILSVTRKVAVLDERPSNTVPREKVTSARKQCMMSSWLNLDTKLCPLARSAVEAGLPKSF